MVRVAQHVAQEPDVVDADRAEQSYELLGELDPVPVGVVDVEQAHLALELEDDPDVHAGVAQAVGLRLQVVDVDVRDAAVLLRLALGERRAPSRRAGGATSAR